MNCVADDRHRRPLADRGSPGRTHGNAVTNPRIRVCSTVVLTALPPAPRTRSILPQPVPDNGMAHPRPPSLTTNIRIRAGQLAVEPRVRLLPRPRRPLLLCVEPPHRPALDHYGHLEKLTFSERAIWMEGRPAGFVARDRNGSAWFLRP